MSRYTVLFREQGVFVDRDARWFKVTVLKDGVSLGIALGVIDGRSWDDGPTGAPDTLSKAAVRLLAITLQDAVEAGQFRVDWALGATEFVLDSRDARHLVTAGVADSDSLETDAAVAFFDH